MGNKEVASHNGGYVREGVGVGNMFLMINKTQNVIKEWKLFMINAISKYLINGSCIRTLKKPRYFPYRCFCIRGFGLIAPLKSHS